MHRLCIGSLSRHYPASIQHPKRLNYLFKTIAPDMYDEGQRIYSNGLIYMHMYVDCSSAMISQPRRRRRRGRLPVPVSSVASRVPLWHSPITKIQFP